MTIKLYKQARSKPNFKALIYAKPGMGKTTLAASAADHPDFNDVLFINIDKGSLSIAERDITFAQIGIDEDGKSTNNIVKELEDILFKIVAKQSGYEKFKTVIIDSATELQGRNLEDISKGKEQITQPDYGKDSKALKKIASCLRDMPLNVIITALAKSTFSGKDDNKVLTEVAPALTASVSEALQAAVDFVWYLGLDKDAKRIMLTKQTGVIRAKTRNAKYQELLGDKVEDPTIPELYAKLLKAVQ